MKNTFTPLIAQLFQLTGRANAYQVFDHAAKKIRTQMTLIIISADWMRDNLHRLCHQRAIILLCICPALTGLMLCFPEDAPAQGDLMSMLEQTDSVGPAEDRVEAVFKTTRLINAQTTETLKARSLVFDILHRFGNVSDGGHGLYGLDNASNIRFAFNYAITDRWMVEVGRSKVNELLDGNTRFRIFSQKTGHRMPVSVTWFSNMGFTPMVSPKNPDGSDRWTKPAHRISYTHQLIVSRKFCPFFSFELLPTLVHRNYVNALINTDNGAEESNDLFALGFAGRVKLTNHFSIVGDYFLVFSRFRENNGEFPYHAPSGIGLEIETGGHVFHLNFTNSSGIVENTYITDTPDAWKDGDVKMGFSITRVFFL